MSDVAALIADMVRAGVDPEIIGRTAAALSAREPVKIVDEQAERRRAKDRERKRLRNSAESSESAERPPVLDKEKVAPKEIKPSPPISPVGSARAQFVEFWSLFPNKVGKRDAEREFLLALQRASFDEIMTGLRRYVAKTDDRPWCNPSTFLHQNRWDDQPASVTRRQNAHSPPNGKRMNAVEAHLSLQAEQDEQSSRTIDHGDVELFSPDKSGLPSPITDLGQAFRWPDGQRDH